MLFIGLIHCMLNVEKYVPDYKCAVSPQIPGEVKDVKIKNKAEDFLKEG